MGKELKVWLNVNPHHDRRKAKQYSDDILQKLLKQFHPQTGFFEVQRGKNGKPFIEGGPHFSYAHSGRLHAYVIDDEPLGIDLERINSRRNYLGVAERHYHETEWQHMQTLNAQDQMNTFYQWWAQKEAWCKFHGGVLWYFLPKAVRESGLKFYDVHDIQGMACAIATRQKINHVSLNVVK